MDLCKDFVEQLQSLNPLHYFFSFFDVIVFILAGAVVHRILSARLESKTSLLAFLFPAGQWASWSAFTDIVLFLLSKTGALRFVIVANAAIGAVVGNYVLLALRGQFGDHARLIPSAPTLLLIGLLAYFCRDFMNYLAHYSYHRAPLLWEFHKVHHSATFLNPLTAERFHPVQMQLDAVAEGLGVGLPFGLASYFYEISAADVILLSVNYHYLASALLLAPLQHSHIPVGFGWLENYVYSPRMHHIHHSARPEHCNSNLGKSICLWDRLFKTFYKPVGDEAIMLGVGAGEERNFLSPLHCYATPIARTFADLRASLSKRLAASG